jgi:hypothetical protein
VHVDFKVPIVDNPFDICIYVSAIRSRRRQERADVQNQGSKAFGCNVVRIIVHFFSAVVLSA